MHSVHGYPIVVLGDVATTYADVKDTGRLTESKSYLLANLVAAGEGGVKSTELASAQPNASLGTSAVRMALSRLRDNLPSGAIPGAIGGTYRLDVDDDDVDLWALIKYATTPLPHDIDEAKLLHLVTPVDAFRNVRMTELLENASVEIAKRQRELLNRIADERPELLRGALLDRLETHLGDDQYNERLMICTAMAIARAGDRRQALKVLNDGKDRLTDVGLTFSTVGEKLELDLLNADIDPIVEVGALRQAYRIPPRLVELRSGPYVDPNDHHGQLEYEIVRPQRQTRVFTLIGESGLGKSRFCAEIAHRIASTTETLYVAPISETESTAFGPLLVALPQFAERVAALALTRLDVQQASVWASLMTHLAEKTSDHPVLLVVDDCQSLDTQSRELISHLAASASIPWLTIMLVARPGQHPDLSTTWLTPGLVPSTSIELGRLDRDAMRSLVWAFHPQIEERVLQHLTEDMLAASDGLPGVAALLLPSVNPLLSRLPDPASFASSNALESLIDGLSEPAATVGLVGSIIGPEFELALLQEITELPEPALLAGLDELVRLELLRERGIGSFAIAHLLVQSAFLRPHLATKQARIHGRAAQALQTDVHRRAYHQSRALSWVDDEVAARSLMDSARDLLGSGLAHEAVDAFRRAQPFSRTLGLDDAALYSRALDLVGDKPAARRVREEALRVAVEQRDGIGALRIATSGLPEAEPLDGDPTLVGHLLDLVDLVDEAPQSSGAESMADSTDGAFELACHLARQLTILGRVDEAQGHAARSLSLAVTPEQQVRSAVASRYVVSVGAPPDGRLQRLLPAEPLLDRCSESTSAEFAVLAALDEYEAGEDGKAKEWRDQLSRCTDPVREWHGALFDALQARDAGDTSQANERRDSAFKLGIAIGAEEASKAFYASLFVELWLEGKLGTIAQDLDSTPIGRDNSVLSLAGRALVYQASGDHASAAIAATDVLERVDRSPVTQGTASLAVVSGVLAKWASKSQVKRARSHLLARGHSMIVVGAFAASLGPVDRYLAVLADNESQRRQHLHAALKMADNSKRTLWQVVARRDLAAGGVAPDDRLIDLVDGNPTLQIISGLSA